MAVCMFPPVVIPKHYDPMFKVDVLLHEPTIASKSTADEIEVDMISLCTQLEALFKKELLQEYLEKTGISRMFPRPAAYLKDCRGFSFTLESTRTDEYLTTMSQLHQLTALSHQISEDVAKYPRPKYLAHQLALLYQCISSLPNSEPLAKHKQSIEDNFKAVKK
ncbi:hypothetical protein BaRGS_00039517, partial [Batillaria attramentaria]